MNYQAYDYMARGAQIMHEGFSLLNDIASHPSNPFSHTIPGRVSRASLEPQGGDAWTEHVLRAGQLRVCVSGRVWVLFHVTHVCSRRV